jgi:hypothetical protein
MKEAHFTVAGPSLPSTQWSRTRLKSGVTAKRTRPVQPARFSTATSTLTTLQPLIWRPPRRPGRAAAPRVIDPHVAVRRPAAFTIARRSLCRISHAVSYCRMPNCRYSNAESPCLSVVIRCECGTDRVPIALTRLELGNIVRRDEVFEAGSSVRQCRRPSVCLTARNQPNAYAVQSVSERMAHERQ